MSHITSRVLSAVPQADGRISVTEEHRCDEHPPIFLLYLAEAVDDLHAACAQHSQDLEAQWPSGM
jgi:hypothetical protein